MRPSLFMREHVRAGAPASHCPRRRAAHLAAAVVLACASGGQSWAAQPEGPGYPQMHMPGFQWSGQLEMRLAGLPLHVRSFVASTPLGEAAAAMARHADRFQRVTTIPGRIMLSGTYRGWHWVAELHAAGQGVSGLVSALPLSQGAQPHSAGAPLSWLHQKAGLLFSQQSALQAQAGRRDGWFASPPARAPRIAQFIYSAAMPSSALLEMAVQGMQGAGWQRESFLGLPSFHSWRRKAERLVLVPSEGAEAGQGALLVHHVAPYAGRP